MRKYYWVSPKLLPFCNSPKMDRESLKMEKPQKEIYQDQTAAILNITEQNLITIVTRNKKVYIHFIN